MEVLMKIRFLGLPVVLLLAVVLPLVAQSDVTYFGEFSEPFSTFSVAGEFTYPGELDWYGFDVIADGSTVYISARSDDSESGVRALLFDSEGTYINDGGDQILKFTLASGFYKLRVDSVASDVQSYSLLLWSGVESESNDGLVEADSLGSIDRQVAVIGSLLPAGDADFFTFEIPEGGLPEGGNALLIDATGPSSGDTIFTIYRYSEAEERYLPIAFDDDSGDDYWSRLLLCPQPLDKYALRVEETSYPISGIYEYLLSIVPLALGMDIEPNDSLDQAVTLQLTSPDDASWVADGLLSPDDSVDFYRVIVEHPGLVQVRTEPQPGAGDFDTELTLFTSNGDLLSQNDDREDSCWSRIVFSVDVGEYLIAVESAGPEVLLLPYRLRITTQAIKTEYETEPNDSPETAEAMEQIAGEAIMIEAAIEREGDIDAFSFVLDREATVMFQAGPRPGSTEEYDTTLALYNEDLDEVAYNDDADGSWSSIEETLLPGMYYVVVQGYYSDETFEYALLISKI
jgi:hypothetical protein